MFHNPFADGIVIVVILLLFFGPKRLPMLSRSIGESIKEFKGGVGSGDSHEKSEIPPAATAPAPTAAPAPAATAPVPSAAPVAPAPVPPVAPPPAPEASHAEAASAQAPPAAPEHSS